MANNDKISIVTDNGEVAEAHSPVIVSASRSTDIPGFYADWFLHRLKVGYSAWTNPFNGVKSYVSYTNTKIIIFWSKNPQSLLKENGIIDYLNGRGIHCYVQYTLNDYVNEGLEKGVPSVESRIATFKSLVKRLGVGKVIWRFDPLILTDTLDVDDLLSKIKNIGDQLIGYTEKLVFSFADIESYRKVKSNLEHNNIKYRNFSEREMLDFTTKLADLNKSWGYILATCGEKVSLEHHGVEHNKCIDDDLMIRFFSDDEILMSHLGVEIQTDLFTGETIVLKKKNNKDKGQRQLCGCIASKDIGEYNTCAHLCEYCYANASKEIALQNLKKHKENPLSETITGK